MVKILVSGSPLPSSPHWGGVLLRSEFLPQWGGQEGGLFLPSGGRLGRGYQSMSGWSSPPLPPVLGAGLGLLLPPPPWFPSPVGEV